MKIIKSKDSSKGKEIPAPREAAGQAKPEKPAAGMQKADARISSLEAKAGTLFRMNEEIMKQLKEMALKLKSIRGLDEIEKLSKDAARDLAAMKSFQSKIGSDSGRAEKIFSETQKKYADIDRIKAVSESLSKSLSDSMKEISGLKEKIAGMPERSQLEDIRKSLKEKSDLLFKLPKDDIKSMKEFSSKSGYLEKQVSDLHSKLDDAVKAIEIFSGKVVSIQKDILDMKKGKPSKETEAKSLPKALSEIADRLPKIEKENSGLKSRIDEMEEILEQMSSRLKDSKPSAKGQPEMKAVIDKISGLEERLSMSEKAPKPPMRGDPKEIQGLKSRIDDIEDVLEKLSSRLKEAKASAASKEEPKEMKAIIGRISGIEDSIKSMNDQLHSLDSGLSGLEQKPEKEDPDAAKALRLRLDTVDSRITGMSDKLLKLTEDTQKLSSYFLEGMNRLETRLKFMERASEAEKPAPAMPRPRVYLQPSERTAPTWPPAPPASARITVPDTASPRMPMPPTPPSAQNPPSTIFTKLREGTVARMPAPEPLSPGEQEDIAILKDHIMEGLRRRESRGKITQDLINAGYDEQIISRAFSYARAD